MKRNDIPDIDDKLFFQNYENLFNVYETKDGYYYYNITRKVNIPEDISISYYAPYIVEYGDTWTGLAYKFYNDVKLWWIICVANQVMNPCTMPTPGYVLNILRKEVVQDILSVIRDN
jgi:hypothetical protein